MIVGVQLNPNLRSYIMEVFPPTGEFISLNDVEIAPDDPYFEHTKTMSAWDFSRKHNSYADENILTWELMQTAHNHGGDELRFCGNLCLSARIYINTNVSWGALGANPCDTVVHMSSREAGGVSNQDMANCKTHLSAIISGLSALREGGTLAIRFDVPCVPFSQSLVHWLSGLFDCIRLTIPLAVGKCPDVFLICTGLKSERLRPEDLKSLEARFENFDARVPLVSSSSVPKEHREELTRICIVVQDALKDMRSWNSVKKMWSARFHPPASMIV